MCEKIVFVDCETAGLELWRPIIEVAAIAVSGHRYREVETFEAKIQFAMEDADPDALGICKFKPSVWERYALPRRIVAKKFSAFLRRHATLRKTSSRGKTYKVAQLAAHNAHFDGPRLRRWYRKERRFFPASPQMLCSFQLAKWFFTLNPSLEQPRNLKLQTLSDYFCVPTKPDHTALTDVRATVEVCQAIRELELNALTAVAA